ncbi:MAG: type II toxin-antitoxin system RelE/ParE family toxin [Gammaproteobacteria bacterium]|nr:type II toxin-antitoxin system RelE/ParE family toxin [Gammaproteobacteria bacterium]
MKEILWIGDSKKKLLKFPRKVIQEIGYALYISQEGGFYNKTKPFKGFGSGLYEIAVEYDKDAYRSVYFVSYSDNLYVLHCFQKKSKRGIKTPKEEVEIIRQRLKILKETIKG